MDVKNGHAVGTVFEIVMKDGVVAAVIGGRKMKKIDGALLLLKCLDVVAVAPGRDLAGGVSVLSGKFFVGCMVCL